MSNILKTEFGEYNLTPVMDKLESLLGKRYELEITIDPVSKPSYDGRPYYPVKITNPELECTGQMAAVIHTLRLDLEGGLFPGVPGGLALHFGLRYKHYTSEGNDGGGSNGTDLLRSICRQGCDWEFSR